MSPLKYIFSKIPATLAKIVTDEILLVLPGYSNFTSTSLGLVTLYTETGIALILELTLVSSLEQNNKTKIKKLRKIG